MEKWIVKPKVTYNCLQCGAREVTLEHLSLDATDSTNSYARSLQLDAQDRWLLVTTDYQLAGRGAGTNSWESAAGENLLLSLRLRPVSLEACRMFGLSEVLALALSDTVSTYADGFSIKWPNDLYHCDDKVAGMLIENSLSGGWVTDSTLGLGLNVNQMRFESDAPNPASLAQIVGRPLRRETLLDELLEHFAQRMAQMEDGATETLHREYCGRLYRREGFHPYADARGVFSAAIEDVEPDGHLLLRDTEGGLRKYAFKEVSYISQSLARKGNI
ncbi:MAG: biotin--[acetyl-CoA-carboxylase] ligase [Bacteroidaceae bacterium]|nr:biotin--[acetyl-CoA-carboxylase] ligase [Bacteroidaceae bacterium]